MLGPLLLLLGTAALASHASAQMGGGNGNLLVEVRPGAGPPRATAGSPIRLRGASFDENGRPVEIHWGGEDGPVLATVPVDGRGDFVRVITVPSDAAVGPHLITATQRLLDDTELDPRQMSIDVVATAAEVTVETEPAKPTSSPPVWPIPAGLGFAGVLALGLILSRRRRRLTPPGT